MSSVDERVVEMRFDNAQFEAGVQKTMGTVQNLNDSLNKTTSTAAFDNITKAANNVSLSAIQDSVTQLSDKFSAMGVVAFTVLQRITNQAINTGTAIAKSLTVQPLMDGYREYETKMGSIQTILANTSSKGTTLDDVNNALNDLNTYSDKTIYNFTEMTKNIGTFTAAGIDLNTSANAIKGIANLAAVSGSTSQQASVAMYQLSQAMASGTVKLMDWNSVVNAGMGGQVFQDSLKQTARTEGIAIDDIIAKNGSFRESLQAGWLTTDILTKTLQKFTLTTSDVNKQLLLGQGYTEDQAIEIMKLGDTATAAATKVKTFSQLIDTTKEALGSGWANSWEIIIGNFNEAEDLLTGISNYINDFINNIDNARNAVLQAWKDAGGRTALINGLKNAFDALMSILGPISQAFADVFPPITGEKLADISKKFEDFTGNLKNSLGVVTDASDTVVDAAKPVVEAAGEVQEAYNGVSGSLQDLARAVIRGDYGNGADRVAALGDSYQEIQDAVNHCYDDFDNLDEGLDSLTGTVGVATDATNDATDAIDSASESASDASTSVSDLSDSTSNVADQVKNANPFVTNLADTFKGLFSVVDMVKKVFEGLATIFNTFVLPVIGKAIQIVVAITGAIGSWIAELDKALPSIDDFNSMIGSLSDFLKPVADAFSYVTDYIIAFFGALKPGNDIISNLTGWFDSLKESITNFLDSVVMPSGNTLLEDLQPILEPLADFLSGAYLVISKCLGIIGNAFSKFFDQIDIPGDPLGDFIDLLLGALEQFIKFITPAINAIVSFANKLGPVFDDILTTVANFIADFVSNLHFSGNPFDDIMDVISVGWNNIISFIDGIEFPNGDTLLTAFKNITQPVIDFLTQLGGGLGSLFTSIFAPTVAEASESIGESGKTSVEGETSIIQQALQAFADFLSWVSDQISTSFTDISNSVGDFIDKIEGFSEKFLSVAQNVAMIYAGIQVGNLFGSISYFMKNIGSVAGGFSDLIHGLGDMASSLKKFDVAHFLGIQGAVKAWQDDLKADAIKKIAISIGILAVSLWIVSQIPAEDLEKAGIALVAGLASMVIASKMMASVDPKSFAGMGIALFGLAVAVGIITLAVDKFSKMDTAAMEKGVGAVIGVCLGLAGAIKLMQAKNGATIAAAGTILGLAIAVFVLEKAVEAFANMDTDKIVKGLISVAATLVIIVKAINGMSGVSEKGLGTAATIFALAIAIGVLAFAIEKIGNLDVATIVKGLAAICVAIFVIGKVVSSMNANGISKGNLATLVGLIGAIFALYYAIKLFADMPWKEFAEGGGKVALIIAALAGAVWLINKSSSGSIASAATISALAIACIIIAGALWIISAIPTDKLADSVRALIDCILALGVMIAAINSVANKYSDKTVFMILAMCAAVAVLTGALWVLANKIPSDKLIPAMAALSVSIIAFGGALYLISKNAKKITTKSLLGIVAMAGVVVVLAYALKELASCGDMKALGLSALYLSGSLIAFAGALSLVANYANKISIGAIGGILALSVAVVALSAGLYFLSQCDPGSLATALLILVGALGAFVLALAAIGFISSVFSEGFAALSMVLVAIGGAVLMIGAAFLLASVGFSILAGISDQMQAIADGLNAIAKVDFIGLGLVGLAIGVFGLGAAAAGWGLGMLSDSASNMPAIVDGLNGLSKIDATGLAATADELWKAAPGFIAFGIGAKLIGDGMVSLSSCVDQIPAIVDALPKLSDALTDFSGIDAGKLAATGLALIPLGLGMVFLGLGSAALGFGLGMLSDKIDQIPALATDLATLNDVAGLNLIGVGLGLIFFGLGLAALSFGLGLLSGSLDSISQIADGLAPLSNLDGGNLLGVGIGLAAFGVGSLVAGAGLLVLGFSVNNMQPIADGLNALSQIDAGNIGVIGLGLVVFGAGAIVSGIGIAILSASASTMPAIASGLDALSQIDAGNIGVIGLGLVVFGAGAVVAGLGLMLMSTSALMLPIIAVGLLMLSQVDAVTLGILGGSLIIFGAGALVGGLGLMLLSMSAAQLPIIAIGLMMLAGVDGAALAIVGASLIVVGIGSLIGGAGLLVLGAGANLAGSGIILLASGILLLEAVLSGLIPQLDSAGSSAVDGLAGGISNAGSIAVDAIGTIGSGIISAITSGLSAIGGIGSDAISALGDAISGAVGDVTSAASGIGSAIMSGISSSISGIEEIGRNIVTGLGQGIQDGISWIIGVAEDLGKSVLDAAKHALGIASPSKEFFAVGMYINKGLANGVDAYAKVSKNAVSDVANDTISIMSDAASKISGAMDTSTSYSPSITPVLDLSEIQNGSNQIDSMMTGYNSMVSGSVEFGSYSAAQLQSISDCFSKNQEAQYANAAKMDSVVTKLSDIGSRITTLEGNLPGYIYENTPSQVVMDGTKVGKMVAPTVNIEMGISQVRENRGL